MRPTDYQYLCHISECDPRETWLRTAKIGGSKKSNGSQDLFPNYGTPIGERELQITLEPVEKAIADGVFCSRILKDRDQSSFLGISLAVCFFGRVSPL